MEMNTRLQVEHPVTEMITGTDLVEWQLRVAAGEQLPLQQSELQIHGHAIEARVYAENPEKGFLPSIGTLRHARTPDAVNFVLGGSPNPAAFRIDSGVREGDTISPFYDPMIAKMIVWGKDRTEALARMAQALSQYQIVGLHSNIAFLSRLITSQAFSTADLDTGLIERNQDALFPTPTPANLHVLSFAAVALISAENTGGSDPWQSNQGWRMNTQMQRGLQFVEEHQTHAVQVTYTNDAWVIAANGNSQTVRLVRQQANDYVLAIADQTVTATVVRDGEHFHIFSQGVHTDLHYNDVLAHAGEAEAEGGRLTAPMPGKIVAVVVKNGQEVKKGEALLIMEAMKMEHTISAPHDGVVEEVLYAVGDQVTEGAPLLNFKQ
jgi:3-methylcrotonyl-CoA carboxylase alpha subunit